MTSVPSADEFELSRIFRTIWRRKSLLFVTVALIALISSAILYRIPNQYEAEAILRIEPPNNPVAPADRAKAEYWTDSKTVILQIETQKNILTSREFAGQIVDDLHLERYKEFNKALGSVDSAATSGLTRVKKSISQKLTEVRGLLGLTPAVASDTHVSDREYVIDEFLKTLRVSQVPGSSLISIHFRSQDPKLATSIANTVANEYINYRTDQNYRNAERATEWLSQRLQQMSQKLLEMGREVEDYRSNSGLIEERDKTVISQKLTNLAINLQNASAERGVAETRLREAENSLTNGNTDAIFPADVPTSSSLSALRDEERTLQRQKAELSLKYGPKHPKILDVDAKLNDAHLKIENEYKKIVQTFKTNVEMAKAHEKFLELKLRSLRDEIGRTNRAEIQLSELERKMDSEKKVYESFLAKFKEMKEEMLFKVADVFLAVKASTPTKPIFPRKKIIFAVSIIGGIVIGLVAIFIVETTNKTFLTAGQLAQASGLTSLGVVPKVSSKVRRKMGGDPVLSEAIQTLMVRLGLRNHQSKATSVLITSAVPGEGKSFLAATLARHAASADFRVLLVDTDFRRPSLHKLFGVPRSPGLGDAIAETQFANDVIRKIDGTGVDLITAGGEFRGFADVRATERIEELLGDAASQYDLIIFDSPPTSFVSDSIILSSLVERTIFVVRWGRTKSEMVLSSLRTISEFGGKVDGVALSYVNTRKYSRYDATTPFAYRGNYKRYLA